MMHQRLIEALEDVGNNPTPLLVWYSGNRHTEQAWMRLSQDGSVQFGADDLPSLHYDLIWDLPGEITHECLTQFANDPVVARLLQAVYAGYEVVEDGGFRVVLTPAATLASRVLSAHIETHYYADGCLNSNIRLALNAARDFSSVWYATRPTLSLLRNLMLVEAAESWLRVLDAPITDAPKTPLAEYHARSLDELRREIEGEQRNGAIGRFARQWGLAYAMYWTGEEPAKAVSVAGLAGAGEGA